MDKSIYEKLPHLRTKKVSGWIVVKMQSYSLFDTSHSKERYVLIHSFCFKAWNLPSPSQTTFFSSHSSHCSPVKLELMPFSTTPLNTTVGVTWTPCILFILTNTFKSLVTWFPVFKLPSLSGLSEIYSKSYISFSLRPTLAPSLARRS